MNNHLKILFCAIVITVLILVLRIVVVQFVASSTVKSETKKDNNIENLINDAYSFLKDEGRDQPDSHQPPSHQQQQQMYSASPQPLILH